MSRSGVVNRLILCVIFGYCTNVFSQSISDLLHYIVLPPGFSISIFTEKVPGAREMSMSPSGTLFIGTKNQGVVYAVKDTDNNFYAETVDVIAKGLQMPNGVAFFRGNLYVAEIQRILRFDSVESKLPSQLSQTVVNSSFPVSKDHSWKFIAFGPDSLLYIPVGMPCNICRPDDKRYGTIMRMHPDGSSLMIFARGIRNTVGFDWQPGTGIVWFTDNGRDLMGDNIPPDELNRAPEPGLNFGFPYCNGDSIPNPGYGTMQDCRKYVHPVAEFDAHVATLGMRFYTGNQFPSGYSGMIFVAEHGSWNRTQPIGYRIETVDISNMSNPKIEIFAEGWLQNGKAWGRPVDVLVYKDGSLLVSDDKAGVIYRISYNKL